MKIGKLYRSKFDGHWNCFEQGNVQIKSGELVLYLGRKDLYQVLLLFKDTIICPSSYLGDWLEEVV